MWAKVIGLCAEIERLEALRYQAVCSGYDTEADKIKHFIKRGRDVLASEAKATIGRVLQHG